MKASEKTNNQRHWKSLLNDQGTPVVKKSSRRTNARGRTQRQGLSIVDNPVLEGNRNNELTRRAGRMRRLGATEEVIANELLRANAAEIAPPLAENEVLSVAQSVARYEPEYPESLLHETAFIESDVSAAQLLREMNDEFAVITAGSTVAILRETFDAEGHRDIKLLNEQGFKLLMKNRPSVKGDSAVTVWLKYPSRREYEGLVFDPSGRAPAKHYNLYRGFATEPKAGSCGLFLRFVLDVICSGDEEHYAYVEKWMAHLVQRPAEMAEVALVLRSGQGTGKNTFVMPLAGMLGQMFFECTNIDRLAGNFNGHLKDKLLVHANEATWGGNKSAEGTLKAMITDPWRAVEHKGKDVITVRNYTRLVISSNEEWPVACGPDDRRFVFLDVSEDRKQDHAYFKAIHDEFNNGGVDALHDLLLKVDIEDWHPRQRPKPRYGADVKVRSLDVVGKWWFEVLDSGTVQPGREGLMVTLYPWRDESALQRDWIVGSVEAFARRQPARTHVPYRNALFKRLRQLCPGIGDTRPTLSTGHRPHQCVFPPLNECRRSFEEAMGCVGSIDWSEPEFNEE